MHVQDKGYCNPAIRLRRSIEAWQLASPDFYKASNIQSEKSELKPHLDLLAETCSACPIPSSAARITLYPPWT